MDLQFEDSQKTENNAPKVISVYAIILRIIAVVSIIMGIVLGRKLAWETYDYDYDYAVAWGWGLAGIINAFILWGLSIIVEACHKYLHQK